MQTKKNAALILGILIPVFMIVFVAATIYLPPLLPGIFPPPKYNFIYLTSGAYKAEPYVVQEGKLGPKQLPPNTTAYETDKSKPDQLFVYDVKKNKSKEITLELVQVVNLDPNVESPDGFVITS